MSEDKWDDRPEDRLGSLAQSARQSSLKQARGILIAIGVLSLLGNAVLFALSEKMVKDEIAAEKAKAGPGVQFDQAKLQEIEEQAIRINQLVAGFGALLGVIFIVLGVAVYRAPVACTVTGLVLYLAGNAIFGVLDPVTLAKGLIIKIIIIVCLVKAVQAAMAYEREAREAALRSDAGDLG